MSASISTPVRSTVRTVAVTATPSGPRLGQDLHAGERDGVAERDQVRRALRGHDAGEPRGGEDVALLDLAGAGSAGPSPGDIVTKPRATATRSVFGFAPTSIIFMGGSGAGGRQSQISVACSPSQRSASMAAMQPVPAAVIAWR